MYVKNASTNEMKNNDSSFDSDNCNFRDLSLEEKLGSSEYAIHER